MQFAAPQRKSESTRSIIGQTDDRYEQEADHVADQVMRMPQTDQPIQRKCADCEEEEIQMMPISRVENNIGFIQRKEPFQDKTREFTDDSKVPTNFNYELKNHQLIAHTVSNNDLGKIIEMVQVLAIYSGKAIDENALRTELQKARENSKEGDRKDIDVTTYLPAPMQTFLSSMEEYYSKTREYVKTHGERDAIFERMPKDTPERRQELGKWDGGSPSYKNKLEFDYWTAVCHEFATIAMGGAASGTTGQGAQSPAEADEEATTQAYITSMNGEGPYRKIAQKEVKIGDIAVFKAGKKIPGVPGGVIHSAVVIKVEGGEVELLEKMNPFAATATRTVKDVLSKYAGEKASVHYLSPAFGGMPVKATKNLGSQPPADTFTDAQNTDAKDRENTHVLFLVDSDVLLAHEDLKLFQFIIAQSENNITAKVHGYASEDGGEVYNFNLSAHRAVAVKNALSAQLPGAQLEALAHGETTAFGSKSASRRAGIEVSASGKNTPPVKDDSESDPSLVPSLKWSPDQPNLLPDGPLSFQLPMSGNPSFNCQAVPQYPDFLGLLQRWQCDIHQNLEDNAHHFSLIKGLYPERTDLEKEAFLRYFSGANMLKTGYNFFGASSGWSSALSYGTGILYKTLNYANTGELTVDLQVPIQGFQLELNGSLVPQSEEDKSLKEWSFQLGLVKTW